MIMIFVNRAALEWTKNKQINEQIKQTNNEWTTE